MYAASLFKLFLTVALLHVHISLCSTQLMRMRTVKVEKHNGMTIVRQRSLDERLISPKMRVWPRLRNLSYDDIYGEWTKWSKCRKRCKQVRKRKCKVPQVCQSNTLREERDCTGHRCKAQSGKQNGPNWTPKPSHGKPRGQGRVSEFRVLYQLQSIIYSQWSDWSACTSSCHTKRSRDCVMKMLCENNTIQEDAICYTPGSDCERQYKPQTPPEHETDSLEETESENMLGNNRTGLIDDSNCGITSGLSQYADVSPLLRIIGGRKAYPGRWPWMVAILNQYGESFCGGTLITPYFVLTAAHCVRPYLQVRAGEYDLVDEEGHEQEVAVVKSIKHPKYDQDTVDNDIALLMLKRPLKLSRYVSPICLPSSTDQMEPKSKGIILGWGKKNTDEIGGSDVLRVARVPIAEPADCKEVYRNYYISENMVCAGYKNGKADSCAGDSGGPLLYRKKDTKKWYLYGITSFGEGCGKKGRYGIYAKVPNSVEWIRQEVEKEMSSSSSTL